MPEIYLPINQPYCALQIQLSGPAVVQRRAKMFDLLAGLYQKWHAHNAGYVPFAVDFDNYASLDLAVRGKCNPLASEAAIADVKSLTSVQAYDVIGPSAYVSSAEVLYQSPLLMDRFRRFNPHADIGRCMIVLDARPSARYTYPWLVSDEITRIGMKYRFPFADVSWLNQRIFITLARYCDEKARLYGQFIYALNRENLDLSRSLRLETEPDISAFFRARTPLAR